MLSEDDEEEAADVLAPLPSDSVVASFTTNQTASASAVPDIILDSSAVPALASSTALTVAQALALRQAKRQMVQVAEESPAAASSGSLWASEPGLAPKNKPDPNRQVGDGKPKLSVAEALAKRALARAQ